MGEPEWLASNNPEQPFRLLRRRASRRKQRLFACACCRRIWHLFADQRSQKAVDAAELYADGQLSREELVAIRACAAEAVNVPVLHWGTAIGVVLEQSPTTVAVDVAIPDGLPSGALPILVASLVVHGAADASLFQREREAQSAIALDVYPVPFPRLRVDSRWLQWNGGTVLNIAQAIYDERAFNRLPILADALEDAGCDNADILAHCRGQGPHVRGCWVVDLLLGKK